MIELPWRVRPNVDKRLLKIHLNRITTKSGTSKAFTIQIPISVFDYIKDEGINAEIIELARSNGVVTIRVIELKSEAKMLF